MNDCPNAEMRDRLPDLLHERLDAASRAAVAAHVDGCEDCRAEVELLRSVRGMLAKQAPPVDVNYIVGGLPLPAKRAASRSSVSRFRWADWRVAAAVTMLAVGGTSVALMQRVGDTPAPRATAAAPQTPAKVAEPAAQTETPRSVAAVPAESVPSATPSKSAAITPKPAAVVATDDAPAIGVSSRLSDLSESQLKALLNDIDRMQAVPITEPEPVSLGVGSTRPSGSEGM